MHTLDPYRHSGKFNPRGLLFALAAAALAGLPLGLAYAYLLDWIPFVYVNILATFAYGYAFGWMTTRSLQAHPVRNLPLAVAGAMIAGLIALYLEWSAHIHVSFTGAPWFLSPGEIWRGMGILYEQGTWGVQRGEALTGIPLAIVWIAEAGTILVFAVMSPYKFVRNTPFCEKGQCWLDEDKPIDTLEAITDPAQLAALKAGDIQPVILAKPKTGDPDVFTRLLLKRSSRSDVFCTLRVQTIAYSLDRKGNIKIKTKDLTRDLIIPASMFELLAQFEHLGAEPGTPA